MTLQLPQNLLNCDNRHMAMISGEVARLKAEADTLAATEYLVSTNQGTYGEAEACRKVGTSDPKFADRNVYETVGGKIRTEGPEHDDAPGRMRNITARELKANRKQLAEIRKEIARLNAVHAKISENLGWN